MNGKDLKDRLLNITGLSLADIAGKLGMSPQHLNQTLNAADIKTGFLEKVCKTFGTDMSTLFGIEQTKVFIKDVDANVDAPDPTGKDYRLVPLINIDSVGGLHSWPEVTDAELSANGKKIKNPVKGMLIEKKRRELQDRMDALMIDHLGQEMSSEFIAARIIAPAGTDLDFFTFSDEWLGNSDMKGKKNYICTLNALEKYIGERKLPFTSITYDFLEKFEKYLSDRPRAKTLYLGLMRHLYREAMRKYNTDSDQVIKNDPFSRFRVPKQVLEKGVRALSLDQLLGIIRCHCLEGSRAELAHDCFILSFCLMGMNSVDMYNAKTMKGDTICYNRTKTRGRREDGAYIEVRIHPVIRPFIEKYRGDERVFNFYTRYRSAADFNRALNIGLKDIGTEMGIDGLNFYQARHTFATLSRNLMRFSKSDVDEALNHVGGMDLADVYIKKDFSIINDNNFKLIDRVKKELEDSFR